MFLKLITITTSLLFFTSVSFAETTTSTSGKFTLLNKGDKAPFKGTLFDPVATAKIIDAQKETYEKEKEAILDAEIEKKKMTAEVEKEYEKTVAKFKVLHKVQRKELTEDKEKEIKKIIKKNYNKPEKITSELSDMFGIKHVPKINNDNN